MKIIDVRFLRPFLSILEADSEQIQDRLRALSCSYEADYAQL